MNDIHKLTIKEIKERLMVEDISASFLELLASDERVGVKSLLNQYERTRLKRNHLEEQWQRMNQIENGYRSQGLRFIAGIDEVGRGPLAGPVVAAAVILSEDFYLPGLNDSKKLTAQQREDFFEEIKENALAYSIAFVDAEIIDQINIYQATLKAIKDAVIGLDIRPEICLIDGRDRISLSIEQKTIIGGDRSSVSIAAASVIAKVTRDHWMQDAAKQYPYYGFEKNMGYGTPDHLQAIEKSGPCPLHRKSFAGVKEWL